MNEKFSDTIKILITLLSQRKYVELATLTGGLRLSPNEIKNAIDDYGRTIVMPPTTFFSEDIDVTPIKDLVPRQWSVVFPLWTAEEGKSDLSVEITCVDTDSKIFGVELDNIHVL